MRTIVALDICEYADEYPPQGLRYTEGSRPLFKESTHDGLYKAGNMIAAIETSDSDFAYGDTDEGDDYDGWPQTVTVYDKKYEKVIRDWCIKYEDETGQDVWFICKFPLRGSKGSRNGATIVCGHCGRRAKEKDDECRGCGAPL